MTHFDDDLTQRLASLVDQIPLPPTIPDEDIRRGRARVRRIRILAASGVAVVVAVVLGTTVLVAGSFRASNPDQPVNTPTPSPTVTEVQLSGVSGPDRVLYISDLDDGFIAVGDGLASWYRDAHGWRKVKGTELAFVASSPNGKDGVAGDKVTHDGGRTWQPLRLPAADCHEAPVLLSTGIFVITGPCASGTESVDLTGRWTAYWQSHGSGSWERRPAVDVSQSFAIDRVNERLVIRLFAEDGFTRVLVSRDTGVSWVELPDPCGRPPGSPGPYIENGLVYQQCADDGAQTVFTLGDDDAWQSSLTVSPGEHVLPLGSDRWLVSTSDALRVVTPAGGARVVGLPWGEDAGTFQGTATAGDDIYVAIGRGDHVPLWVSHDDGRTWQREGA